MLAVSAKSTVERMLNFGRYVQEKCCVIEMAAARSLQNLQCLAHIDMTK